MKRMYTFNIITYKFNIRQDRTYNISEGVFTRLLSLKGENSVI